MQVNIPVDLLHTFTHKGFGGREGRERAELIPAPTNEWSKIFLFVSAMQDVRV